MKRASSCDEIENVPHVLQQHHTAGLRHRRQPALTPLAHGHCGRPSLLSLPDDCVARILDSLGVEQLLRVTCVSRTLTELCMSNAAWRRRCALAGLGGDLLAAAQRRAERRAAARRSGRESGGTGVGAGIPAHGDGAPVAVDAAPLAGGDSVPLSGGGPLSGGVPTTTPAAAAAAQERRSGSTGAVGAQPPDYRELYFAACLCDHRQGWRAFAWEDGLRERAPERTEALRLQPGEAPSLSLGCSCRRCGRSFAATFTALKAGEDGIDSFRTWSSWLETAVAVEVLFRDKAAVPVLGETSWRETWLEEYYWQRARHQTLITLLLMLLFLWWWPADWERGGYLEWPPFSSPSRWPAWTWEGFTSPTALEM